MIEHPFAFFHGQLRRAAAGYAHSLALKADGTIVAWGDNTYNQTNVPAIATNAIAIAAGGNQSLALRGDGTVVQWGLTNGTIPAGLTNVTAIASGTNFNLALLQNTTVIPWGANDFHQTNVPADLTNVVAIAAGSKHGLAVKLDGTVTAWGHNASGQTNVPAGSSNFLAVAAGDIHSVALKNDGTVVAWGNNSGGETNVLAVTTNYPVKLIAGGGNFTLAAAFSPLVQYPVDVSRDLLLIYNTNSLDSYTVMSYYLTNRPMVANASVFGIGYTNSGTVLGTNYTNYYETIGPVDMTNRILAPVSNWLTVNPTKRPQYVILFLDVPSRVNDYVAPPTPGYPNNGYYSSVQYQINSGCAPGWNPFVTSINMNGVVDCTNYVNKLKSFGTNNSLIIGARVGGYGNTNYYFDDALDTYYADYPNTPQAEIGLSALIALTNIGVSISNIYYQPYSSTNHIAFATNVSGYVSYGTHAGIYPNLYCTFGGQSEWFIMTTVESFNGRLYETDQSTFVDWFSASAFGGSNYSSTPIGVVSTVDEPNLGGNANSAYLFGGWQSGKIFAITAWSSKSSPYFQAVGDPFISK